MIVLAAAALGALAGLIAGFVAAVVTLQAKRLRNGRLMARGIPPYRDCVLPKAMIVLVALLAALTSGALAPFVTLKAAVLIGSLSPAALLMAVGVLGALWQAMQEEFR